MNSPANISMQRPVDLGIDPLAFHPPGQKQQPADYNRRLGRRLTGKQHHKNSDPGECSEHQRTVGAGWQGFGHEPRTASKFGSMEKRNRHEGQHKSCHRHGRKVRGEVGVSDMREAADHHVLRIAGDRRCRPDIRGHCDREQVGNRVASQRPHQVDDQRRQHEADRVIDEKRREDARDRRDCGKQHQRAVCAAHDPRARHQKEAREAKVGNHDHHPKQQGQDVEIDRLVGFVERERTAGDRQRRTHQGNTGSIEC
jgi:hypothetical protein